MSTKKPADASAERRDEEPRFDDVLKRMLSTPPDPKRKAKPMEQPAEKKPAK